MQVGAGALAAATALFFSSSIGIAGTVLGAAVGSVVTTFSSTIYKSFLTASDSAIKRKIGIETVDDAEAKAGAKADAGDSGDAEESPAGPVGAHSEAAVAAATATSVATADISADAAATEPANRPDIPTEAFAMDATSTFPAESSGSVDAPADATSVFIAAQIDSRENARAERHRLAELRRVRNLADQRKERRAQQLIAGVSLVTGVVAVAVCAAVILVATNGNGLGRMPQPNRAGEPAPVVQEVATAAVEGGANNQVATEAEANEQVEQVAVEPEANEAAAGANGENAGARPPADGSQAGTTTTTPSGETSGETAETTPAPSEGQEGDGSTGGSESSETGGSTGADGGSGDSGDSAESSGTDSESASTDVVPASVTEP